MSLVSWPPSQDPRETPTLRTDVEREIDPPAVLRETGDSVSLPPVVYGIAPDGTGVSVEDPGVIRDLEPQTEVEKHAAMRAVYEERKLAEGDALIESLTERERLLVEEAWDAGAAAERQRLTRALANPQAATLDAAAVVLVVKRWGATPSVAPGWEPQGWHRDSRVVGLVRRAVMRLGTRAR